MSFHNYKSTDQSEPDRTCIARQRRFSRMFCRLLVVFTTELRIFWNYQFGLVARRLVVSSVSNRGRSTTFSSIS